MGDHHPLRPGRRAARVVDREEIALVHGRGRELRRRPRDERLVIEPPLSRAVERDKMPDARQVGADRVDGVLIIGMRADDGRAAVGDQVAEIVRDQPIVERHQHGANLRDGIERLELRVRIRRDVGDPIPGLDAGLLQPRRPSIAPLAELGVGERVRAVEDGRAIAIQPAAATEELQGRQRCFHRCHPLIACPSASRRKPRVYNLMRRRD